MDEEPIEENIVICEQESMANVQEQIQEDIVE